MANRIVLNETSYHGAGAIQEVTSEAKTGGFRKVFVCSNPDLIKFDITCRVTRVLEDVELTYEIYSNIKPNLTIENVQTGIAALETSGADYIIVIDGGFSTGTPKVISVIITNPEFENVRSLEDVAPTKNPCVSIIAVPTTADTTTEVTIDYVTMGVEKKRKLVCTDTHGIPVVAVVDPEMMSSMPRGLTATTGMDALTHAIEDYTTEGVQEMTDIFNLKTIEIIARSSRNAVGNKPESREGMALGQYLTGMRLLNCGPGIVHSMVHDLNALYDTPHGVANAIILLTVMEYNTSCTGTKFKDIVIVVGMDGVENMAQEEYHKAAVDAIKKLPADAGISADLKEILKPEDMDFLSQSTIDDACRPGNLKDSSFEDIKNLYLSLAQLHIQPPMAQKSRRTCPCQGMSRGLTFACGRTLHGLGNSLRQSPLSPLQPCLSRCQFFAEYTVLVFFIFCLMMFKKHISVGYLARDFDFTGDVRHGAVDAFALVALHVLCPLHNAAALCQRNLELALYPGYGMVLENVMGNDIVSCQIL